MVIKPVPSDDASKLSWIDASSGEPFMVFSNGKNPVAGMGLRCLPSKRNLQSGLPRMLVRLCLWSVEQRVWI